LVDWDGVFKALSDMGYTGRIGMEGFSDITDNMSTWVWRKLAPNGDAFLKEGIAFIKRMLVKYNLKIDITGQPERAILLPNR
jgi:D-psicose/D-tagatose/L-ribulose 3-epimerase